MMDWTDRHCRYFHRLLSSQARLYTEMVTTGAVLQGDRDRLLGFDVSEHPVALQLGGSDPGELAESSRIGADWGYDEINLNIGCPSDRVQSGRFGACLMLEPQRVADCLAAMTAAVNVPVTVKTRIGVDDHDSYEELTDFVECCIAAGCRTFIVHARKAWLQGLSPRQNREIPPLRYEIVQRLKRDFSDLAIVLNGGLDNLEQAAEHLRTVDGVMFGRAAYQTPYRLAEVDARLFGSSSPVPGRHAVVRRLLPYLESQLTLGVPLQTMIRPMLGLFQNQVGARAWRRHLSENAHRRGAGTEVVLAALRQVPEEAGERATALGYA
ncbi:MAG: tRNA dihydrouridine(20/20a) synthase DusA [Gammaproteobacteria bacterium]|nr:tRNA dihydrouridine(20/20a) synthase DusA [Gammaproteobacteria bacterium]MCP5459328.1 tRNA dihydrouridine(20/20a) synthase DusA [Gammaproteobacteria bacterium]